MNFAMISVLHGIIIRCQKIHLEMLNRSRDDLRLYREPTKSLEATQTGNYTSEKKGLEILQTDARSYAEINLVPETLQNIG